MRPADVRKLSRFASQAPYGQGTETIIDQNVRETLEVDAKQVRLLPEFTEVIEAAIHESADCLQLEKSQLQVELYKLLIYPKGGFFLPHRDSEKRKSMVATMIVVLPSRFGAGDLVIWHQGNRQTFSFDEARSQKQPQFVAFFADCEHEVKKVTSGVRVCLTYNLIIGPERKSKSTASKSKVDSALRGQVVSWIRHRPSTPLVFALDHQYTEAGLTPPRLKGTDKELHQSVEAVANSLRCRLYFGQVERHLCQHADDGSFGYGQRGYRRWSGDYDDLTIGEVYKDEIVIDGWRDASGEPTDLASLACHESQLISLVPVEDWIPTRQDYEGYTGNAGNTLDRWYHKSIIAIWPKSKHFEILAQMGLHYAIAELLEMRAKLPGDIDDKLEQTRDDCWQLAAAIINHWPNRTYERGEQNQDTQPWLKQFVSELPNFDDPRLIERLLQTVAERDWRTNLNRFVLNSLRQIGVDEILPALEDLLRFNPPPNEYGIRFLDGLATRDAEWLLELAKDKRRGGLSWEQLQGLFAIAIEKLSAYAQKSSRETYHRGQLPIETWRVLCQAIVAAGDERLGSMIQLAGEYPGLFDFRSVQIPIAVELRDFSAKRHDQISTALSEWLAELTKRLMDATAREPQPPADFRRESDTGCDCRFCRQLSKFLSDPTQKQTKLPAAEAARKHLEHVIYSRELDVMAKTVRVGRPYSLELTKTIVSYDAKVQRYHDDLKLLKTLR